MPVVRLYLEENRIQKARFKSDFLKWFSDFYSPPPSGHINDKGSYFSCLYLILCFFAYLLSFSLVISDWYRLVSVELR